MQGFTTNTNKIRNSNTDNSDIIKFNNLGIKLASDEYSSLPYGFIGSSPLLVDAPRGQRLVLDRPHYSGSIDINKIYTPEISSYGKGYSNYHDIYGGQIQYYVREDLGLPYYRPNYVQTGNFKREMFVDPMGQHLPHYDRNNKSVWNKKTTDSFTYDSVKFREELTSLQTRKINQQRWEPMHYQNLFLKNEF